MTQTNSRDPRDLPVYSAEDFARLEREAAERREKNRRASMTFAQSMNELLAQSASRYIHPMPWEK